MFLIEYIKESVSNCVWVEYIKESVSNYVSYRIY